MKTINKIVAGAFALALSTAANALPVTFDLTGSSYNLGSNHTFTSGAHTLDVTASQGQLLSFLNPTSFITQNGYGIGVSGTANWFLGAINDTDDQLSNNGLFNDSLNFDFGSNVLLNSIVLRCIEAGSTVLIAVDGAINTISTHNSFTGTSTEVYGGLLTQVLDFNGLVGSSYLVESITVDVPEPGTIALMSIGLIGLVLSRKRLS